MESTQNEAADDLVTVFRLSAGGTDEMEVETVQALLEANGIETVLVGDAPMPNLSEEIRVKQVDAQQAKALIADALAAGPAGADEAEAEGEK